ncbi:hypothetical protein, partial [Vitiosangium sp. GDMCC 1.1324]|uniref:hypothetical protein n=1 Tax=Vitiosangium sp. (strain GDMCC 1.1324) TaxID=2138576 RepID=UPI000D4B0148
PRNVFKGRGRARFDTAEMVYVLEDVLIELRPHGALWTASLPVGGTLDVTLNDASGPWVWRFTDETPHPSMR